MEHLWTASGHLEHPWRNKILPDGASELIFNLGDAQSLCSSRGLSRPTLFRKSWISGERTEPIVIEETGHVHLIGVRFRPSGGWPFLGVPMGEFTNRVIELDAVLGREIDRLCEQMAEAPNDDARFRLIESWLLERMRAGRVPSAAVGRAVAAIREGTEGVRIGQMAATLGLSHKHLLREFDRCVGLTPKVFSRILSFQRAIAWIGHRQSVEWADAAVACGYYDQAHFIREFRSFSGFTPQAYLEKRGPFLNYITLESAS